MSDRSGYDLNINLKPSPDPYPNPLTPTLTFDKMSSYPKNVPILLVEWAFWYAIQYVANTRKHTHTPELLKFKCVCAWSH